MAITLTEVNGIVSASAFNVGFTRKFSVADFSINITLQSILL